MCLHCVECIRTLRCYICVGMIFTVLLCVHYCVCMKLCIIYVLQGSRKVHAVQHHNSLDHNNNNNIYMLHFVDVIVTLCMWYYCVDILLFIIDLPQASWELHKGQHHSSLDCVITFRRCCCDTVYVILLCLHAFICYLFAAGKQGITWIETTQ